MISLLNPHHDAWDLFVSRHAASHVLQTSPWGELKAKFGWTDQRIAVGNTEPTDTLVAGALVLYRRLPAGMGRLAYVPKGPVVTWANERQVATLVAALDSTARARGAIALTIEPDLPDEPVHRERLHALGFRPSPFGSVQPRRTIIVDITPDEEAILRAMKSKTRYNIRLAVRRGVTVREATEADMPAFHGLMETTAARNRFGVHSPAYYETACRLFVPRGWARILLAHVAGDPVAAVMAFALPPQAWYFYGASSDTHREKMPTYLLQWEAMRWARSRGCTTYDLWGVPDEELDTLETEFTQRHDGLWGVYRFKRGFGGELVRSVGAWDRVYAPARYRAYRWMLSSRRRIVNARSSVLDAGS